MFKLAKRRKSVRRFKQDPVDINDVLYAVKTAKEAPSGANLQPWRFIIVTDPNIKRKIRSYCEEIERKFHSQPKPTWFRKWLQDRGITWRKPFLTEAPILIVAISRKKAYYSSYSTWLAIGYLLLALEERELASLTYTPSNPDYINNILNIPDKYKVEAIIPVGIADEDKPKEPRLSTRKLVFWNRMS